uniref:Uncharacterized protein n=1 Tax=Chromera velia CCMP2878 TaxID=1169474 RepID=A0A0G4G308_9ALVE|eukprot:Cvel_20010.t1-p1 / transcript=Cvel_20010.t1 / gene=Cvel_20010 / organism=Chromera_velia_CCMP2878 / gene_product=hypothetical protein / transcript_product=hypothetical protein / location=Cvel_scaffold1765:2258-10404(-) / protein_length=998 / sequence_SO=supercontig / SO=protein_coding / is_pseudo=false
MAQSHMSPMNGLPVDIAGASSTLSAGPAGSGGDGPGDPSRLQCDEYTFHRIAEIESRRRECETLYLIKKSDGDAFTHCFEFLASVQRTQLIRAGGSLPSHAPGGGGQSSKSRGGGGLGSSSSSRHGSPLRHTLTQTPAFVSQLEKGDATAQVSSELRPVRMALESFLREFRGVMQQSSSSSGDAQNMADGEGPAVQANGNTGKHRVGSKGKEEEAGRAGVRGGGRNSSSSHHAKSVGDLSLGPSPVSSRRTPGNRPLSASAGPLSHSLSLASGVNGRTESRGARRGVKELKGANGGGSNDFFAASRTEILKGAKRDANAFRRVSSAMSAVLDKREASLEEWTESCRRQGALSLGRLLSSVERVLESLHERAAIVVAQRQRANAALPLSVFLRRGRRDRDRGSGNESAQGGGLLGYEDERESGLVQAAGEAYSKTFAILQKFCELSKNVSARRSVEASLKGLPERASAALPYSGGGGEEGEPSEGASCSASASASSHVMTRGNVQAEKRGRTDRDGGTQGTWALQRLKRLNEETADIEIEKALQCVTNILKGSGPSLSSLKWSEENPNGVPGAAVFGSSAGTRGTLHPLLSPPLAPALQDVALRCWGRDLIGFLTAVVEESRQRSLQSVVLCKPSSPVPPPVQVPAEPPHPDDASSPAPEPVRKGKGLSDARIKTKRGEAESSTKAPQEEAAKGTRESAPFSVEAVTGSGNQISVLESVSSFLQQTYTQIAALRSSSLAGSLSGLEARAQRHREDIEEKRAHVMARVNATVLAVRKWQIDVKRDIDLRMKEKLRRVKEMYVKELAGVTFVLCDETMRRLDAIRQGEGNGRLSMRAVGEEGKDRTQGGPEKRQMMNLGSPSLERGGGRETVTLYEMSAAVGVAREVAERGRCLRGLRKGTQSLPQSGEKEKEKRWEFGARLLAGCEEALVRGLRRQRVSVRGTEAGGESGLDSTEKSTAAVGGATSEFQISLLQGVKEYLREGLLRDAASQGRANILTTG